MKLAGTACARPSDFIRTIRTGVTPYDKTLDEKVMPWRFYAKMTDEELSTIRAYIASVARRDLKRTS